MFLKERLPSLSSAQAFIKVFLQEHLCEVLSVPAGTLTDGGHFSSSGAFFFTFGCGLLLHFWRVTLASLHFSLRYSIFLRM
jgi:hypothetical protein